MRVPTAMHGAGLAAALFLSIGAIVACSAPTMEKGDRLPEAIWGGDRIHLSVTARGGTTDYDCAHGTIDQTIELDRDGRFSATGTHVFEHGGPVREDEPPDRHPARYDGRVNGEAISLTVTLTDRHEDVGTFTLKRDVTPRLHKCL